jgi:hypothetical protein
MAGVPTAYGPGGPVPTVTPSGSSILDRGYGTRTPASVPVLMPQKVPVTAYVSPGAMPAQVGPSSVQPPGPLGPLSLPHLWPESVPYTT